MKVNFRNSYWEFLFNSNLKRMNIYQYSTASGYIYYSDFLYVKELPKHNSCLLQFRKTYCNITNNNIKNTLCTVSQQWHSICLFFLCFLSFLSFGLLPAKLSLKNEIYILKKEFKWNINKHSIQN